MIKSMTGFGRAEEIIDGKDISVEIKSVNHRYLEMSLKVPRNYGYIEEKLKSHLKSKISRGKLDVSVTILNLENSNADVEINASLAKSYVDSLREIGDALSLNDDLSLSTISRFQDIFIIRKSEEDEDAVWSACEKVANKAIDAFVAMREAEGTKMKEDLLSNVEKIEAYVSLIEKMSPETSKAYYEKLYSKMQEILSDSQIDEQRLITEAAIFSEKIAVDEETVRLKSHISQFREIIETDGPVGRKLDFLIQEFNREANTIGSKAQNADIAKLVVEIKSDIEKIREQIQNVE